MLDLSLLSTIALLHLVALASPGPDFAIMLKIAREQTRTVAIMAALGIALAILIHTLASLTGLSLIIHTTPWLYVGVQLMGALYLGYMGLGALLAVTAGYRKTKQPASQCDPQPMAKPVAEPAKAVASALLTPLQGLRLGLYTNLLNPKALVFFLTLFSAMVGPQVNLYSRVALVVLMFSLSFAWFGWLAVLLTHSKTQTVLSRFGPLIDTLVGILFLLVSISILLGLLLPAL